MKTTISDLGYAYTFSDDWDIPALPTGQRLTKDICKQDIFQDWTLDISKHTAAGKVQI